MGESSTSILNLAESALNSLKKSDSVQKILDLKRKVVIDADLNTLCEKTERLTESINQTVGENKKLQSGTVFVKNVNHKLEEKVVYLEKIQAKGEQYSRRNNAEISDIPNSIPDEDLENTVISICKDSGVEIDPKDIESCHRLPLSRNSRRQDERVIVKFVNRKHSEALLRDKKQISSKNFNHLNVLNKAFASVPLCPYYRYIWDKCKDLQRQGQVNHIFCIGVAVCIKLSENGRLYHINDIPDFPL